MTTATFRSSVFSYHQPSERLIYPYKISLHVRATRAPGPFPDFAGEAKLISSLFNPHLEVG